MEPAEMSDKILQSFLDKQSEQGKALEAESDILRLQAVDGPPGQRYLARLAAKGLAKNKEGQIVEAEGCVIGIWLPDDYLRRAEPAQVLTYLGPHPHPWHPNIMPPFICVHLRPGMPLVDLLYACFEIWTWRLYNTGDEGLNHGASQWARAQDPSRWPVDRRPLKRRRLAITVSPAQQPAIEM
jgi:hypothetical protein